MEGESRWSRRTVVYQVYPRSFADGDNDGIGDLKGITSKLGYINSLGAGAVWLSPIYKSPMADFGYDVSDYRTVDPIFGTMDDFKKLIKEAHGRDLKIMMDFVPNHTSDQHPWFKESRSSINNAKREWYIWASPKRDGGPPNNWLSVFGGSAWELDKPTGQYYLHSFLKDQPDLNWRNPELVSEMLDTLQFWLDLGVDGFRIDAVHWLYKDAELCDNPPNPDFVPGRDDPYSQFINRYNQGQDETYGIINKFSELLGRQEDAFMVTEVYVDIGTMQKYFRCADNRIHSPFNLNLIGMPWDAEAYREFIINFEKSLAPGDWPNYVLGNHDQPRVVSRLGEKRARAAALIQMTLRGMPFIYYGEEIGMRDGVVPDNESRDPFGKGAPALGLGRDKERTPMQWDGSENAGFSRSKPWLAVNHDYKEINVKTELGDNHSMLHLYKELVMFRGESPALLRGEFIPVRTGDNVLAYERRHENDRLLVIINFSDKPCLINMDYPNASTVLNTFLDRPKGEILDIRKLTLRGNEGYIFKI